MSGRAGAGAAWCVLTLLVASCCPSSAEAQAGWRELDLGAGRRATRYLPASVRPCDPLPLLLFLHGAGGTPEAYGPHLDVHAEALGLVLLLPQASGAGWSSADAPTLNAALDALDAELLVDDTRTYLGGHSAGGAFSYLLAYDSTGIAAVFSMSAPFYSVGALGEPGYPAPIRMYYGDSDPNYTGGSADALAAQWERLGVPHETDVQAGYAHSTWPPSSIRAGLEFLLRQRHPGVAPSSRCDSPDAGASVLDAAVLDAGSGGVDRGDASGSFDVGPTTDARSDRDALATSDAGARRPISTTCGCRVASRASSSRIVPWLLAILVFLRSRRRTRVNWLPTQTSLRHRLCTLTCRDR